MQHLKRLCVSLALLIGFLGVIVTPRTVGAQPTSPNPVVVTASTNPTVRCASDFRRCNMEFPGRYRNQRTGAAANIAECAIGTPTDEAGCDGTYQRTCTCGPPVMRPGPGEDEVTLRCGGRPNNTRPHVHNRTIIVCREDMGLRYNESGWCELQPDLPSGYNYAIVRQSVERANGQLTERLRVAPHTYQETYGGVAWPNGEPRPNDLMALRILGAVIAAQERLAEQVRQNTSDIRGLQGQTAQNTNDIHELQQRPIAAPAPTTNPFRLQFDGALVGLGHWNASGNTGGGFALRPAFVLRWSESFGLRVFGGWGMGGQSNTPYHLRLANGGLAEQSAPLHLGTFGIDGLIGSGSFMGILGIEGFVAGRTAPALLPGDVSGLLAWRVSVRAGVRIRLGGEERGFQFNLDLAANLGVSNVSGAVNGRFFSPTTVGAGGEIAFCVTR